MDKKEAERKHAKRRAYERFGISLNRHQLHQIVLDIQNGKAKFVDKQSCRVTRWHCTLDGHEVIAVYDKKRKAIVTFLTPEMVR